MAEDQAEVKDPDSDTDLGVELAPWVELTPDQRLRAFIFKHYASSGEPSAIDGKIFVDNIDAIFQWIKDGHKTNARRSRARLDVVEGEKK